MGFGGDPNGRCIVLWGLTIGPGKTLLLNDLTLWELA